MKVIIVGYGTVGRVTEVIMPHWVDIITYDINHGSGAKVIGGAIPMGDIYFICTHEDVAGYVIGKIRETNPEAYIVVRSTVGPGFCIAYHQHEPKGYVIHFPAFMKETNSVRDFFSRVPYFVIGSAYDDSHNKLISLIEHHDKPIILTDPDTSALAKLVNNAKLAAGITFWNEIYDLSERFNANIETITRVINMDSRHQNHGTQFFGKPWEGKCLPKDVNTLVNMAGKYDGEFLKALQKSNEILKYKKNKDVGEKHE